MPKELIKLSYKPKGLAAPGLLSSAGTKAAGFVFLQGKAGALDDSGKPVQGIEAQTRQALENFRRTVEAAGGSMDDVLKTTVFLIDAGDFNGMNKAYLEYFPNEEQKPARSTVIVAALAEPDWLVEIEGVAYCP